MATSTLQCEEVIRVLSERGQRVAGTDAGASAIRWATEHLGDMGFQMESHEFACTRWEPNDEPLLSVEGVGELACAPMLLSPSGTFFGRIEHYGSTIIWGDKRWTSYRVVGEDERIGAYILARFDGEAAPQPLPEGFAPVPHVAVGASHAEQIKACATEGAWTTVSLHARSESVRSRNVRAWVGEDALERGGAMLVTAHMDTVPSSPGAYDNAGGVAALLRVAECIVDGEIPGRIQLLLTDAEELYLEGSRAFVRDLSANGCLDNVSGCLNLDGAGRGETMDVWFGPETLADTMLPLIRGRKTRCVFPPPQSGDHFAFWERGFPAIMLTLDDPEIIHRAEDVYAESKVKNAERMADMAVGILSRLSQEGVW